ncbi:hypothetical protein [Streptomyces sp. NPDC058326]|uniref:hypothetical protein n=1 Tax=Streptomyces sp. NPDC058326 TaxID=3346447 RepID=UPI0036E40618
MKRPITGTLRRTGVVAAAVATALLASAGVASAATGSATASGTGVYGSANWEWTRSGWKNGNAAVRDTGCDGEPVYVHFRAKKANSTYVYSTVKRFNYNGCRGDDGYWTGLGFDAGYYITSVQVVACVDTSTPRCYFSAWQDNPLT